MIQTILLLLIPCICYGLADSKLSDDKQATQDKQQTKSKHQNKQQTISRSSQNSDDLDPLFLDDDFDINDIIKNRSSK